MRKRSAKVSVLNKITKQSLQKVILRDSFGGFVRLRFQEKILQSLFKIKEGTIFAIEHQTTSGPRIMLEYLKKEGFVKSYGEGPQFADYPKFYHASVGFEGVEGEDRTKQMSWGFAFLEDSPEVALYKGLIESLERHANYFSASSKTVYYPAISYGDASWLYGVSPHPRKEQMQLFPVLIQNKENLQAVRGFRARSLLTGRKRFLPLQAFYFGLDLFSEKLLSDSTTSGTGAGSTADMATLSALYELIERDHFHLYWFAGVSPVQIDVTDDASLSQRVENIKQRYNLEVYFFDLSYDYETKVCLSVIIDPVLHIVSCGAKAGQSGRKVIEGALLESLAVLNSLRETGGFYTEEKTRDLLKGKIFCNEKIDKNARMRIFSNEYGVSLLKKTFLFKNKERISFLHYSQNENIFKNQKEELSFMLSVARRHYKEKGEGYDMFIHKLSSRYADSLGLSIVHVFCPALLKLHLNEIFSTPLSPRLTEFAKHKGKKNFSEKDINSYPHFFP